MNATEASSESRTALRYVYGIVRANEAHENLPLGMGGAPVSVHACGELAALVSAYDGSVPPRGSRANLLAHEKAVEAVVARQTVLPVPFGTVAPAGEVCELLQARQRELLAQLDRFEGKVEFGLKAFWTDMPAVYARIAEEEEAVKRAKARLSRRAQPSQSDMIEVGQVVEAALAQRKKAFAHAALETLAPALVDSKELETASEDMCFNGAFLIRREAEAELDRLVEELGEAYEGEVRFKYVGPSAPYRFVASPQA